MKCCIVIFNAEINAVQYIYIYKVYDIRVFILYYRPVGFDDNITLAVYTPNEGVKYTSVV